MGAQVPMQTGGVNEGMPWRQAELLHTHGSGKCCELTINSCNFAYFAQYGCIEDGTEGSVLPAEEECTGLSGTSCKGVSGWHATISVKACGSKRNYCWRHCCGTASEWPRQ